MDTYRCLAALGLTSLVLASCRIGGQNSVENENSLLRETNAALRLEVAALQQRLQEWEATAGLPVAPPADLPATIDPTERVPAVASIELDRLSGPVDANGDGQADGVRLYAVPRDGQGRVLPMSGMARVHVQLTSGYTVEHVWDLAAFRASFRRNFTGTHFRLDLPFDTPQGVERIDLEVWDLATGAMHRAQWPPANTHQPDHLSVLPSKLAQPCCLP
jgi:hypothetical protein